MNLKNQIPIYDNASSDNFDSNNIKIHCTPTNSMIHKFLNVPKRMNYENTTFLLPQVKTFTL
jgi:hypothetical protein